MNAADDLVLDYLRLVEADDDISPAAKRRVQHTSVGISAGAKRAKIDDHWRTPGTFGPQRNAHVQLRAAGTYIAECADIGVEVIVPRHRSRAASAARAQARSGTRANIVSAGKAVVGRSPGT